MVLANVHTFIGVHGMAWHGLAHYSAGIAQQQSSALSVALLGCWAAEVI